MLHVTAILEDIAIVATRGETSWNVQLVDTFKGKTATAVWNDEQFGAIMALSTSGEFASETLMDELYKIATPAVEGLDNDIRPIP